MDIRCKTKDNKPIVHDLRESNIKGEKYMDAPGKGKQTRPLEQWLKLNNPFPACQYGPLIQKLSNKYASSHNLLHHTVCNVL